MSIRTRIIQFAKYSLSNIFVSRGGVLLGRETGAGGAEEIEIGSGLTLTGKVLSSAGGGDGVSDVGDLTTDGLTAGRMLRVAAAGGLEERTPAQTLADIGAADAATNTGDEDLTSLTTKLGGALQAAGRIGAAVLPDALYGEGISHWRLETNFAGDNNDIVFLSQVPTRLVIESQPLTGDPMPYQFSFSLVNGVQVAMAKIGHDGITPGTITAAQLINDLGYYLPDPSIPPFYVFELADGNDGSGDVVFGEYDLTPDAAYILPSHYGQLYHDTSPGGSWWRWNGTAWEEDAGVTDLATTTEPGLMAAADKVKLDGVAAGAEVNVQSDWNAGSGDAHIQNKPTLGSAAAANILDSDTMTGALATNVPSAESVKAYVDANAGGTVDNAAVNAAIATDPEAVRSVLNLSHPWQLSRWQMALENIDRQNVSSKPVFIAVGDSMPTRKTREMLRVLGKRYGISGIALGSMTEVASAGATKADGATNGVNRFNRWETGGVHTVPANGIMTFSNGDALGSSLRANRGAIYYCTGPGEGTFKIQAETNAGAWTDVSGQTDISADAAIGAGVATFNLTDGLQKIRVVGLTGTCYFIGAALWVDSSSESGIFRASIFRGGLSLTQANTSPQTALNTVLAHLASIGPVLCQTEQVDPVEGFPAALDVFANRWKTALPNAEWIAVGSIAYEQIGLGITLPNNESYRLASIANNWFYFDALQAIGGVAGIEERGWQTSDTTHLADDAHLYVANRLLQITGFLTTTREQRLRLSSSSGSEIIYSFDGDGLNMIYEFGSNTGYSSSIRLGTNRTGSNSHQGGSPWYGLRRFNPTGNFIIDSTGTPIIQSSTAGYTTIGNNATPRTDSGTGARLTVVDGAVNRNGLIVDMTAAAPTAKAQLWQHGGTTSASMSHGGTLDVKNIILPGPFADDAAAAAATPAVPVGGLYRVTGGNVAWRQA